MLRMMGGELVEDGIDPQPLCEDFDPSIDSLGAVNEIIEPFTNGDQR